MEDPRATTGYQKLTRPIEVRPNRNYLEAKGAARGGDVDFPSFDSEFRTLYGEVQEYHVIILAFMLNSDPIISCYSLEIQF